MFLQKSMIAVRLKEARNREVADLEGLGIDDGLFHDYVLPVMRDSSWRELHLGSNRITHRALVDVATVLKEEPFKSKLEVLVLTRNQIIDAALIEFCHAIDSCALRILSLGFNRLSSHGIQVLWGAIDRWGGVEELDLDGNSVSETCFQNMSHVLKHSSRLRILRLSKTSLSDDCCVALRESLHQSNLVELHLSKNLITVRGLDAIGLSLNQAKLEVLDLSQNQIVGNIEAFCSAVRRSQLKRLNLSGNKISEQGAKNLMKAVRGTDIISLNMHWNGFSDEVLAQLRQVVQFPTSEVYRNIMALCSSKYRVGIRSSIRVLPLELIRKVVEALYPLDSHN